MPGPKSVSNEEDTPNQMTGSKGSAAIAPEQICATAMDVSDLSSPSLTAIISYPNAFMRKQ